MEYSNEQQNNQPFFQYNPNLQRKPPIFTKRSLQMEMAAMVLAIVSLISCSCIYLSVVCGALAVIFAILSKGGEVTMSTQAKIALGLGLMGLIVTILIYVVSYFTIIEMYGSIEAYLREYFKASGYDFDAFLQEMNTR